MSPFLVGDYMNLKDTTLKIEYIPIDKLTPNKKNARAHHADDIQCIKNSIEQFGMCGPIGVWGDDNIIVEGQGRLQALKELGYSQSRSQSRSQSHSIYRVERRGESNNRAIE